MKLFRELTPVRHSDVFVILDSINKGFDYPIHNHPEFEITLILNASGTRIVGDSSDQYRNRDLALLGPYLFHKWDDSTSADNDIDCRVITIQFDMHLFEYDLLAKRKFKEIARMLDRSARGLCFGGETLERAVEIMDRMTRTDSFRGVLLFLELLHLLSKSSEYRYLVSEGFDQGSAVTNSKRLKAAHQYVVSHFRDPALKLKDVATQVNLSESAFSHFFKKSTNKSFTSFLIDVRLGNACKLLQETDDLVKDVCHASGFNNVANFNRLFKKRYGHTPNEYRSLYQANQDFNWGEQTSPGQFLPADKDKLHQYIPDHYYTRIVHS